MAARKNTKKSVQIVEIVGSNDELYGTTLPAREDEMTGAGFVFTNFNRSRGIAKSWTDETVRSSRLARHAVEVDGVKYASVAKALAALGLSSKLIIKLRGDLVKYGEQTVSGHDFKLAA